MASKNQRVSKEQYITKVLPKHGFNVKATKSGWMITKPGAFGGCPTHRAHPKEYDSLREFMGDLRRQFGFAPPTDK